MKRLFVKISIIIIFVLLITLGFDFVYRSHYHLKYELPNNLLIHPEIFDKYEIVALGNSHAEDGITFDRYNLNSLKLTGSAQSFDYDLAYLKMYSRQIREGALIIITVSPIAFSQEKAGMDDSLQSNYYDGRISPFLIPNIKIGDYVQSRVLPFLRSGYLWRERKAEEIRKKTINDLLNNNIQPPTKILENNDKIEQKKKESMEVATETVSQNYYFRSETVIKELSHPTKVAPKKLDESVRFMFDKWYNPDGFGIKYFEANRHDLENLIKYCLQKKWRPVMITVPISKVLIKALKPDYMQIYVYDNLEITKLQGIEYFDFSKYEKLTNNQYLFSNSDHLSENGAKVFSYMLLRHLINHGYLSEIADKY